MRSLRAVWLTSAVVAVLLSLAARVSAHVNAATTLQTATDALRSTPVYVDRHAERAISPADAARLREAIRRYRAGPLFVAILPASAADAAGVIPARHCGRSR